MAKTLDTLRDEDAALRDMYVADTAGGELSAEDQAAYEALIDGQRKGHIEATRAEVRGSQEQAPRQVGVQDVGDATLTAMAVNSGTWRNGNR